MLVVIDSPRRGGFYGGEVAAPVFKRIAEATLQYLGVPPTVNPLPPVVTAAADDDAPVVPARIETRAADIKLFENPSGVPDVTGLGIRDAVRLLTRAGLTVRPSGDGVVVHQTPAAGNAARGSGRRARRTAALAAGVAVEAGQSFAGSASMTLGALVSSARTLAPDARLRVEAAGQQGAVVTSIAHDSRAVSRGTVFVAIRGQRADGASFAADATARGALAIVAESPAPSGAVVPVAADVRRAARARRAVVDSRRPSE